MSENKLLKPNANVSDDDDDDTVCLGESFFINNNYEVATFTFGSHVLQLLCLQSASTDFDLTGQLVWPGARLLNEYISNNAELLQGCSAIELGSGVGITGILSSRFCREVVLTDHNDEVLKILKKNIELDESAENPNSAAALSAEKLEWGNSEQLNHILQKHPEGFDLVLGADICFQQNSVPPLFDTVKQLLCQRGKERCRFILAYVSRSKMMDVMVTKEAIAHGLQIHEAEGCNLGVATACRGVRMYATNPETRRNDAEGEPTSSSRNRSGHNSSGFFHIAGSRPTAQTFTTLHAQWCLS